MDEVIRGTRKERRGGETGCSKRELREGGGRGSTCVDRNEKVKK